MLTVEKTTEDVALLNDRLANLNLIVIKLKMRLESLLDQLDTIERETAERCCDLIKENMASALGVDKSWTSFAEEAIRNEFLKEKDND